jgi:L-2-hydroxyglutarate oxidase
MKAEVVVIGGGAVGLATAMALRQRGRDVLVLESELEVGSQQTGHNSGVIHSGLYYKPGSAKAKNCVEGRELMYKFCEDNDIAHERCGKLVVATSIEEIYQLHFLKKRAEENGVKVEHLKSREIREIEPYVKGIEGILVRDTGIVNYKEVTKVYAKKVGVDRVLTGRLFTDLVHTDYGLIVGTNKGWIDAKYLINCGGLYSDRIAKKCGVEPGVKIVPFRGEYYDLKPEARHLVRNLIYPVPDSRLPFLGVHFTRMIGGGVECGPNAVLALSRNGYSWCDINLRDNLELLSFGGFWKMAMKFWNVGIDEVMRSFSKRKFYYSLTKLINCLKYEDIVRSGSGVRAQAVGPDGKLIDDFHVVRDERTVHVLNAPSPAATASIAIGRTIADMV